MCQFCLATHGLLAVFPCVVKIGQVDGHAQQATNGKGDTALQPAHHALTAQVGEQPSYRQGKDGQQEVIGHLHMVGNNLQCHEQTADRYAPTALASITECHTTYGGRYESQGVEFPDMSCRYDDEVVTGECP